MSVLSGRGEGGRIHTVELFRKMPFGEGSLNLRDHPLLRGVELLERMGTRANSGPMVTSGGHVFLGGGAAYL